jgi:hypothetical protein
MKSAHACLKARKNRLLDFGKSLTIFTLTSGLGGTK